MNRLIQAAVVLAAWNILAERAHADDWPQWLGSKRDSVWRETGIVEKFPEKGLSVRWRSAVGGGYAGPSVADGRVFVMDFVAASGTGSDDPSTRSKLEGQERILCFSVEDGSLLWERSYPCTYQISYSTGPRATPTVDNNRVYTLGAEGDLLCLDVASGKVVWSKQLKEEYRTEAPMWGFCAHPLVDGKMLICLAGGEGSVAVGLDKMTGKEIWRSLSASGPGYCPPTIIKAGGRRQLVIWHPEAVNGLDPRTGDVFWSVPLEPDYGMSVTAPRQFGNYLFASGHQRMGALLELGSDKPTAEVVWRGTPTTAVYCCNSTPYIENGVIYGVCANQGQLRAVDLKTGKRLWETLEPTTGGDRASHATAFIVKHEDRFFLFNELGDLILARLSPSAYEEISRFQVLEPTTPLSGREVVWSHPAFADRCVFARNDKELVCVSLAAE